MYMVIISCLWTLSFYCLGLMMEKGDRNYYLVPRLFDPGVFSPSLQLGLSSTLPSVQLVPCLSPDTDKVGCPSPSSLRLTL